MNKIIRSRHLWIYIILLASLLLLTGEIINSRFTMHDLEVYYRTAVRMLQGSELYRIESDGHYVYKYSPTAGMYFIPLTVLPFGAAKIVYWLLLTAIAIVVLQLLFRTVSDAAPALSVGRKNTILLLAFLAVGAHIHREWHLGQVNLVLLALYVTILVLWLSKSYSLAAIVLAASLFIKPFGLIFFPYLILKKRYDMLLVSAVSVVLLGLLPFLLYPSAEAFSQLYKSWFQELLIEMEAKQDLLQEGNHTIFSVLARYSPLRYLLQTATAIKVYQLVLLAALAGYIWLYIRMGTYLKKSAATEIALLIAFIPLFAFTSQNAFLFALPCIVLLLYSFPRSSTAAKTLTVSGCLLIGINIRDLMGGNLYRLLEGASIYTFGTVALMVALTLQRYQLYKDSKTKSSQLQNKLA
jgi:hypothetical protein